MSIKSKFVAFGLFCGALVSPWTSLDAVWQPYSVLSNNPMPGVQSGQADALAVNPQGNAIVVWVTRGSPYSPFDPAIASSFYTRGEGWSPFAYVSAFTLSSFDDILYESQGDPDVAMNSSNYAVVVWEGAYNDDPFPGNWIWSSIRQPDGSFGPVVRVSEFDGDLNDRNACVQVNEAGTALTVWWQSRFGGAEQLPMTSFLPYGGTWSTPLALSAPQLGLSLDSHPRCAINSRGDAVAAWIGALAGSNAEINVVTYNASTATWSAPVILDSVVGYQFSEPIVSIDENGNAVATWEDQETLELKSSYYPFAGVWEPNVILSNNVRENSAYVIMDRAGNSTAVWSEFPGVVYSASRPVGGVWGVPVVISQGTGNYTETFQILDPVAVDSSGNVMAVWEGDDNVGFSAFKPFGQAWQTPQVVTTGDYFNANVGLADCGFAVSSWIASTNFPLADVRAAVNEGLLPLIVEGSATYTQCRAKFATQERWMSHLTWESLRPECVAAFNIYCNGELIASVTDGSLSYTVSECDNNCHFTITAVDFGGFESAPIPFVLRN